MAGRRFADVGASALHDRVDAGPFSGEQYDDDLNTEAFILGAYGVWDGTVSRAIVRGVNAYVAIENILDTEYDTAKTPLRSIGWPRTIRVGARITWQ